MSGKRLRVFAARRAVKDAKAILPGLELGREVEALILEGSVVRDHDGGPDAWLALADGWLARVLKMPDPYNGGRYWSVRAVERHSGRKLVRRPGSGAEASERHTGPHVAPVGASLEERIAELLELTA